MTNYHFTYNEKENTVISNVTYINITGDIKTKIETSLSDRARTRKRYRGFMENKGKTEITLDNPLSDKIQPPTTSGKPPTLHIEDTKLLWDSKMNLTPYKPVNAIIILSKYDVNIQCNPLDIK